MKNNITVILFVLLALLLSSANVLAVESTSPLCTIEDYKIQKELNPEIYEACKANDGAFLCLYREDVPTSECRVLDRLDEPNITCEEGSFAVQNYDESGTVSKWFCDNFTFSEDALNLCTKEDRERAKIENPEQYKFCQEKNEAVLIARYDSEDKAKILTDCRVLQQDPAYPSNIVCNDGKYPVQNYVHKTGKITPWFCDTGSYLIPVTVFQK